jgi:hypothetical protein
MSTTLFHTRLTVFALLAFVAAGAYAANQQTSKDAPAPIDKPLTGDKAPKGFTPLFNGKDFTGWHAMPTFSPYKLAEMSADARKAQIDKWNEDIKTHWKVENDEIVNDGKGAYLTTDKDYGDIELLVEYKMLPKGDSGIYLRATPQVQIWDYTKEGGQWNNGADKGSGGLWNNSRGAPGKDPLVLADKPIGEWNSFRIIQLGERTTVYLNGKLVVNNARLENYWNKGPVAALEKSLKQLEVDGAIPAEKQKMANDLRARIEWTKTRPLPRKGPIQLQTHGSEIRWRNLFVREIPGDEANALLRKFNTAEGFVDVFNGKDFTGWDGPLENYQVEDGAILCKPKKGGVLYTKEEYGDFVARLEFKLPKNGNNGLAIRYPGGRVDTAYQGMCELQVLDDNYGHKIDPRQAHGSAYGMVAAHRGYQRPIGEWNYQEATIKGSTIKVELNGTVILDCDLSKVTEYMANSPHPGKDRTVGHFGFAGHNDPVAFRKIQIKRLDKK